MAWKRLGRIYVPDGTRPWARSHAALPTPVPLGSGRFRVLFSARDERQRSSVGWIDIDLSGPPKILAESAEPLLSPGTPGMYDDSGIGVGSVVASDDGDRLYYMGWNLGASVPWRNSIGLAVGDLRRPVLERRFHGPVMDRSPEDPFTLSYPWVLRSADGEWLMWYGSHTAWNYEKPYMHHVLRFARSRDGISWQREPEPAIAGHPEEALARPTVIREAEGFRMWYAYRTGGYRIGCATSADGRRWVRCDTDWGLASSADQWENEMTSYPAVFRHADRLWLIYNGNDYGRTGFGLAVWE
jgi:predicted GH43/DUF377 family glycosyl hydrolase